MNLSKYEPSVLIMMTTYNSSAFLKEQIDSIVNQTYKNWSLIIQDDGSNDDTLNIIKNYLTDSRIRFRMSKEKSHGAYPNFHSLIDYCKQNCDYDYYMLSDHDDIWDDNKIKKFIQYYYEYNNSDELPTLIYGDMRVIDNNSNVTNNSLNLLIGMSYTNKLSMFFSHRVYGCNTFFNKALLIKTPCVDPNKESTRILSHDNFLSKIAAIYGKVYYISEPLMGYRRYDGNVTSNQNYNYGVRRILHRLFNIENLSQDHALIYKQTLILFDYLKDYKIGYVYRNIPTLIKSGGLRLILYVFKNRIGWGKPIKNISHLFVILTGRYKKYL